MSTTTQTTTKNIKTRVMLKHDYEANWNKAENFIPLAGEVIIYDADIDAPEELRGTNSLPRLKLGDGKNLVHDLPFLLNATIQEDFDNKITCGTSDPNVSTVGQFYFKYSE
jgi:hypothetical protein